MTAPDAFQAIALQTACRAVNAAADRAEAEDHMARAIDTVHATLQTVSCLVSPELRLAVLPEYWLTGFPVGESLEEWRDKAALRPGDSLLDRLAAMASDLGLHLVVNAYEVDEAFPDYYFQITRVFAPDAGCVLRSPRLVSLFAPSPLDVFDRWVDRYGLESLLPVADTAIGRLGAIASEEILYPEIARVLALRGAEILLHPTGEYASPAATAKEICRRARAVENMAYLVSANASVLAGTPIPPDTTTAMSKVIDPLGHILAEAGPGETMAAHAEIDIAALRARRRQPGMANYLSRSPSAAISVLLESLPASPLNWLEATQGSDEPVRELLRRRQSTAIAELAAGGRL
ncbi:MAG: nitrilase-related carbon-nitrogen hydrolase [Oceanicaulis sp.]